MGAQLCPDTGALLTDSVEVVPSRVAPARRLTYVDVDEMFDVCEESDEPDLFELRRVSRGVGGCSLGWLGGSSDGPV